MTRFLWMLPAFLAVYHVSAVVQFVAADRFFDFAHYYVYARNLIEGHSLFDLEAPRMLAEQLGIRYADAPPNYPPPFYLGMGVLAFFPYHFAAVVWIVLNELLLVIAVAGQGLDGMYHDPVRVALLCLVVLAFQPLYETLALGQANILLLAGVALTIRLWIRGSVWSGVVLGLVALVKPQFSLLGLLWLRRVEWRHLGTMAVTVAMVCGASLAVVGLGAWVSYLEYLRDFPCAISLWGLNISLRGLLFRLKGSCVADGFGDPMAVVSAAMAGVILGALMLYVWRNPPADPSARFRAAALILCAIFLISPYTQEHHLTVLLIAFVGVALHAEGPSEGIPRWGWVGAYVLLATAYSLMQFPAVHLGLPSILLFGKGIGVILLGVLLARRALQKRQTAHSFLLFLLAAVGGARAAHAIVKAAVMGELTAAVVSEIILVAGLLLSWAVLFPIRRAQVAV